MARMRRSLISLVLLPLAGCAGAAVPADSQDALERQVARILAAYDDPRSPGASVLVRHHGRILLATGLGAADLDQGVPASAGTNYRLASITKQFTAMAIMILAEEGGLRLDDPIAKHIEGLPAWSDVATIRHLLTHTSGILDYEDRIPEEMTRQLHDRDVEEILRSATTTYFAPGTGYRYSNSGYALLARVVERRSGLDFPELLRRKIFEPLAMTSSVAFVDGVNAVANRAYGHEREGGRWTRRDQSSTSAVLGDGGIYSSVLDLARWDAELASPTLVSPTMMAAAFHPSIATDRPGVHYGFGWRIGTFRGRPTLSHTGETQGFRNAFFRFPGEELSIAVLTNRDEGEPMKLAEEIAATILE